MMEVKRERERERGMGSFFYDCSGTKFRCIGEKGVFSNYRVYLYTVVLVCGAIAALYTVFKC